MTEMNKTKTMKNREIINIQTVGITLTEITVGAQKMILVT